MSVYSQLFQNLLAGTFTVSLFPQSTRHHHFFLVPSVVSAQLCVVVNVTVVRTAVIVQNILATSSLTDEDI